METAKIYNVANAMLTKIAKRSEVDLDEHQREEIIQNSICWLISKVDIENEDEKTIVFALWQHLKPSWWNVSFGDENPWKKTSIEKVRIYEEEEFPTFWEDGVKTEKRKLRKFSRTSEEVDLIEDQYDCLRQDAAALAASNLLKDMSKAHRKYCLALLEHGGDRQQLADRLGVCRRTVVRALKDIGKVIGERKFYDELLDAMAALEIIGDDSDDNRSYYDSGLEPITAKAVRCPNTENSKSSTVWADGNESLVVYN